MTATPADGRPREGTPAAAPQLPGEHAGDHVSAGCASVLHGGMTGQGKSSALNVIAAQAAATEGSPHDTA